MATLTTNKNFLSPTGFQFKINSNQYANLEYFAVGATLPGVSMTAAEQSYRGVNLAFTGDRLTFEDLTLRINVTENLENYVEMHTWLTSIGFPENTKQFSDFRSATSNTKTSTRGESKDIGDVKASTPERAMYSDAMLTILTNKNNPVVECRFRDIFPTSLSGLEYSQNQTDVEYLTATVNFKYTIYEIITL